MCNSNWKREENFTLYDTHYNSYQQRSLIDLFFSSQQYVKYETFQSNYPKDCMPKRAVNTVNARFSGIHSSKILIQLSKIYYFCADIEKQIYESHTLCSPAMQ
jgi:hypothetical protein